MHAQTRSGLALGLTLAVAAAVATPAVAAPRATTTVYAGSTSADQEPMVLRISKKRVIGLSMMWRAPCQSGRNYSFGETLTLAKPIAIRAGRFSGSVFIPQDLGEGLTGAASVLIKGTVTKTKITGSFTGGLAVGSDPSGPSDTCALVDQRYTLAHSPGRVFGGSTSQGLPVVLELNSSRKLIRHFHVGWRATCASGGGFQIGDFLTNFSIRAGRFGADFAQEVSTSDGGTATFSYLVSGRVTRTSSKGSLTVRVVIKGVSGGSDDFCTELDGVFKAAT
jgi:hypothetical protein